MPLRRRSPLLPFAVAALGCLLAVRILAPPGSGRDGEAHPAVGRQVTAMRFTPLVAADQPWDLEKRSGGAVLLNFWGPWCPPCRVEMPHLAKLEHRFGARANFQFVSVSCGIGNPYLDFAELQRATHDSVREMGVAFAVYADPGSASRQTVMRTADLGEFVYPTTVLLDAKNTIRALWLGYRPGVEVEMEAVIEGVLAEHSVSANAS